MKQLRILESHETGFGILVEMDAGYVSPKDEFNAKILQESKNMDYRNPFEFINQKSNFNKYTLLNSIIYFLCLILLQVKLKIIKIIDNVNPNIKIIEF